jgi:hypothetical protein
VVVVVPLLLLSRVHVKFRVQGGGVSAAVQDSGAGVKGPDACAAARCNKRMAAGKSVKRLRGGGMLTSDYLVCSVQYHHGGAEFMTWQGAFLV